MADEQAAAACVAQWRREFQRAAADREAAEGNEAVVEVARSEGVLAELPAKVEMFGCDFDCTCAEYVAAAVEAAVAEAHGVAAVVAAAVASAGLAMDVGTELEIAAASD